MNFARPPLADILAHLPASLGIGLIPIAIAAPLAVLLIFVATGKPDGMPPDRAEPQVLPRAALVTPQPDTLQATSETPAPLILVVDDSAVARAKLRRLFSTSGYRVEVASDGVEALDLLTKSTVSVLIAHVQGGLDTEDIPIIAITGHDELQARVHDFQNLYGIFKKPWDDANCSSACKRLRCCAGRSRHPLPSRRPFASRHTPEAF